MTASWATVWEEGKSSCDEGKRTGWRGEGEGEGEGKKEREEQKEKLYTCYSTEKCGFVLKQIVRSWTTGEQQVSVCFVWQARLCCTLNKLLISLLLRSSSSSPPPPLSSSSLLGLFRLSFSLKPAFSSPSLHCGPSSPRIPLPRTLKLLSQCRPAFCSRGGKGAAREEEWEGCGAPGRSRRGR